MGSASMKKIYILTIVTKVCDLRNTPITDVMLIPNIKAQYISRKAPNPPVNLSNLISISGSTDMTKGTLGGFSILTPGYMLISIK